MPLNASAIAVSSGCFARRAASMAAANASPISWLSSVPQRLNASQISARASRPRRCRAEEKTNMLAQLRPRAIDCLENDRPAAGVLASASGRVGGRGKQAMEPVAPGRSAPTHTADRDRGSSALLTGCRGIAHRARRAGVQVAFEAVEPGRWSVRRMPLALGELNRQFRCASRTIASSRSSAALLSPYCGASRQADRVRRFKRGVPP